MTRDEAIQEVSARWERLGLDQKTAPIVFSMDVDNMLDAEAEKVQSEYRKQIGETGRPVPQFSDPAQGE